jgi:hypothetical protein
VHSVFYISNTSQDQPEIPLRVIVDDDTIYDQIAKSSDIAPDLQYIENVELTRGKHQIIFEVSNAEFNRTERLDFDKDKWIFLSYGYKKPVDSSTRIILNKKLDGIKNADSIFAEFYDGRKPSLIFHTMETEPNHH